MLSPTTVCNNILKRGFEDDVDITPMKLQKLMYFVSCEYAKRSNKELFSECFAVWQYGPVLPTVYEEFRSYKGKPIKTYAKDASGNSYAIDEDTAPTLRDTINRVWNSSYRTLNCTPIVRQYGILNNDWGVFLCQKWYQTKDTLERSSKMWWKQCYARS